MGVSVTREMYANFDEANRASWEALSAMADGIRPDAIAMHRLHTIQADTSDPTPRRPAVDAARRARERLWSNECIDARSRAMATADRPGAKSGREVPPKPAPLGPVTIDRGGIFG